MVTEIKEQIWRTDLDKSESECTLLIGYFYIEALKNSRFLTFKDRVDTKFAFEVFFSLKRLCVCFCADVFGSVKYQKNIANNL